MRTLLMAAAIFAALTQNPPSRAADAVMYRGNAAHTGEYDGAGGFAAQRERWRFKTGNLNRSTPAVAGGVVYVGSHTGNLYALDAATGALKWQAALGGEIASSPAVADGWFTSATTRVSTRSTRQRASASGRSRRATSRPSIIDGTTTSPRRW
jgi:hypothetical protein